MVGICKTNDLIFYSATSLVEWSLDTAACVSGESRVLWVGFGGQKTPCKKGGSSHNPGIHILDSQKMGASHFHKLPNSLGQPNGHEISPLLGSSSGGPDFGER